MAELADLQLNTGDAVRFRRREASTRFLDAGVHKLSEDGTLVVTVYKTGSSRVLDLTKYQVQRLTVGPRGGVKWIDLEQTS